MFARCEGHRHQFIVMGYIEPDRRRTDARNLKKRQKKKRAGGGRWGRRSWHDYETEIKTKKEKEKKKEIRAR